MRSALLATCLMMAAGLCGCGFLSEFLGGRQVRVRLVNTGPDPIDVQLYYGDTQEAPQAVIEEFGEEVEVVLGGNDEFSFLRPCDDLQAIFIDRAEVRLAGLPIGPSEDTEVYRDGDDFSCSDTITFRFSYTVVPPDLAINFIVE